MRKLFACIFLTLFALGGCINVDPQELSQECERILEEERPKIVAEIREECALMLAITLSECNSMCNDLMDEAITDVQNWCSSELEQALDTAQDNLMGGLGCEEDGSDFGWDCSEANICTAEESREWPAQTYQVLTTRL